jgi:hypothetical protein
MVAWSNLIPLLLIVGIVVAVTQAQDPTIEPMVTEEENDTASAFSGHDQIFAMLKLPHVRKELELIESQEKKIDELIAKMTETWNKMKTTIQEEVKTERQKIDEIKDAVLRQEKLSKFNKLYREIQKKQHELHEAASVLARKEIDEVLLPHQRDRMRQLVVQKRVNARKYTYSSVPGFMQKNVPKSFELTSDQQEQCSQLLKTRQDELRKLQAEFQQRSRKVFDEWNKKFEDVLTPDQKKDWKNTIGEPFEFNPPPPSSDASNQTTKP